MDYDFAGQIGNDGPGLLHLAITQQLPRQLDRFLYRFHVGVDIVGDDAYIDRRQSKFGVACQYQFQLSAGQFQRSKRLLGLVCIKEGQSLLGLGERRDGVLSELGTLFIGFPGGLVIYLWLCRLGCGRGCCSTWARTCRRLGQSRSAQSDDDRQGKCGEGVLWLFDIHDLGLLIKVS